ncbi:UNVERIFIED_CONTAM: hypothetical protein FKN15_036678 [Acipenser sinensis]
MAFYEYVSEEQLTGFDMYKYSAVDSNPLSVYVMHPFWNSVVKFLPTWLAPNLITFTGFIFLVLNFLMLAFFDYDFYASGMLFVLEEKYSAVDSNPLSVYVMHPFWNSVVKFLPTWLAPNLITFTGFIFLVLNFLMLAFFDYDFYASVGCFALPNLIPLQSDQTVSLVYIVTAVVGVEAWYAPIFMSFHYRDLFTIMILDIIEKQPRVFYFMVGTAFANITCKLIVCQMSKTRCQPLSWLLLPMALVVLVILLGLAQHYETLILYVWTAAVALAHIHYGVCVRLTKLKSDGTELVTNIQVAADSRESQRRTDEAEARRQRHFANVDAKKFQEIWLMNEEEVKELVQRALETDRIIHEQQLGLAWEKPHLPFMERSGPIVPEHEKKKLALQLAEEVIRSKGNTDADEEWEAVCAPGTQSDSPPFQEQDRLDTDNTESSADQPLKISVKTIKRLLEILCDETGFLIESKLLKLLSPLEKDEQSLMKLDAIFMVNAELEIPPTQVMQIESSWN